MSHIGSRGEQNTIYTCVENFSQQTCFKALRGSLKRTISASGGPRSLQMVSELNKARCASKDAGSRGGGPTPIGGKKENTIYTCVETFPQQTCFKALRGSLKRTISASGGPRSLQMVSELNKARCASKDAGSRRGWIWWRSHTDWRKERVPARTLALKVVNCDVPHWLGRRTKHHL